MSDDSTEPPPRQPSRRRWVIGLTAAGLVVAAVATFVLIGVFDTSPSDGSAQPGGSSASSSNSSAATEPTAGTISATTSASRPAETTTAGDLETFSPSEEKVFSNGTVKLGLRVDTKVDLIGWFTVDNYGDGHIAFTEAGLVGQNGTQFALLDSGSDTSFATCRDQTAWTDAIDWPQLRRGSFACLRTFLGRRGILRVDEVPDFNQDEPVTVLTGSVWETAVDR